MIHSVDYLRALATALNWALTAPDDGQARSIRVKFYASDAYMCRRRLGLQFMEIPRDPVAPRYRDVRRRGGTIHEEYRQRLLTARGIRVVEHERTIEFHLPGVDIPVRGRFDFLVEAKPADLLRGLGFTSADQAVPSALSPLLTQPDVVRFLIDVKSTGRFALPELAERGARLADRAELALYQYATGTQLGFVIYDDKDRALREVTPSPYDPQFLADIADWFRGVSEEISAGRIPDAEFDPAADEYPCGSCPFRTFCASLPNRIPLKRTAPTADQVAAAEALLADAVSRLGPIRDSLAGALADSGKVQIDGASASQAWWPDAVWDAERLAEILVAHGFARVPVDPPSAERLVRNGHLPASALADAKRPGPTNRIVLRL